MIHLFPFFHWRDSVFPSYSCFCLVVWLGSLLELTVWNNGVYTHCTSCPKMSPFVTFSLILLSAKWGEWIYPISLHLSYTFFFSWGQDVATVHSISQCNWQHMSLCSWTDGKLPAVSILGSVQCSYPILVVTSLRSTFLFISAKLRI